jgi:hypothetical protein
MPYTYKSLALMWLITLGLFGLTGFGGTPNAWLPLLILAALAMPILILRRLDPLSVLATPLQRPKIVSDARRRSPIDPDALAGSRWENEGGA